MALSKVHGWPRPPAPTKAESTELIRSRRVTLLVIGIVVLSIADLIVTLAYLKANWMLEANPLAAWIIRSTQSLWVLAAFKVCTVSVCAALLLKLRRFRSGEIASWCGVAVLTVMSLMWREYSDHLDNPETIALAQNIVGFEDGRLGLP